MRSYRVNKDKGKRKHTQKPNDKDGSVPSCGKTVYITFLLIQTLGKSELTLFLNEDPDRISKSLVLCLLNFTAESFTNKAHFDFQKVWN